MKKVIIVGASSGIGKELTKIFSDNKCTIGITGRRFDLLEEIAKTDASSIHISTFDITKTETIDTKLSELVSKMGGLDILVISSGVGEINLNLDFEIEKQTIETNVLGFTFVAAWAFNYFEKQKTGHLAAITSIAGIRGSRQAGSYNASKAFQINYLEGLQQKASRLKNVFVTDIRPGFVDTKMAKGDGLFWVANLNKAASQIYKAIVRKRKIAYITKRWRIIGTLLHRIPSFIYRRM